MANNRPTFSISEILNTLNSNNYYTRNQIDRFNKFSRFGFLDPYNTTSVTREYVFFTKPDLHLFDNPKTDLNPELSGNPFFTEAYEHYRDTMYQLQESVSSSVGNSPFCNLLTNCTDSSLDIQDISVESLETAANIANTRLEYPMATTTSNNIVDFNLEFKDTNHIDVYMFFRIWFEYELLKCDGEVSPPKKSYILNKILHDQMSCYKIIVGEDGETIIYWAKLWGVFPTSIPRSAFNDLQNGPIKIPVSFRAQWAEDMDPSILSDFNKVAATKLEQYKSSGDIPIYNTKTEMVDGRWCHVPHIVSARFNGRKVYKLKWR